MKGWVYVIVNRSMPGLVKVGFTLKDPELRAQELSHSGAPHPYLVEYEALVDEPRGVEQAAHSQLRSVREGKEWFRCSPEEAVATIKEVADDRILVENYRRLARDEVEQEVARQRNLQEAAAKESRERQLRIERLRADRAAFDEAYASSLKKKLPRKDFWAYLYYFFPVFFPVWMAGHVLFGYQDDGFFGWAALATPIISYLIIKWRETRVMNSPEYKESLRDRDNRLSAIDREIERESR